MDNSTTYPQGLCDCRNYCDNPPQLFDKFKTNKSIPTCTGTNSLYCKNRYNFDSRIIPQHLSGYSMINPRAYTDKQSPLFDRIQCSKNSPPAWISWDPRLFSASHAEYLTLDRPPMDGNVRLKDIYDKSLTNYGKSSNQYTDINDGQITYYVNKSRSNPFYSPLFAQPAEQVSAIYVDPMGSVKPEYTRNPIVDTDNPMTSTRNEFQYNLSFIEDSQSHREDLLALQMRQRNAQRWMPRWENN